MTSSRELTPEEREVAACLWARDAGGRLVVPTVGD
jgi:hypothetical protein